MIEEMNANWKPGDPIGYVRTEIPEFDPPRCEGERYDALVPDTLDLAERAKLVVHALTEPTDALADYEPYWIVFFRSNPPQMIHNWWHSSGAGKFLMALHLARLMSGSEQNLHVQQRWMEAALKMQGPDGLIYMPVRGRPWAFVWCPPAVLEQARSHSAALEGQDLCPFGNATMLGAFAHLAMQRNEPVWCDAARRLVDALACQIIDTGDMAFFHPSICTLSRERPRAVQIPTTPFECEGSVVPHALVQAYRLLGYEPALALARKFNRFLRSSFYGPDGSFLASPGLLAMAHFHAHARGLLAMLEFAEAARDSEWIDFVRRGYELARDMGANQGIDASYRVVKRPGADLIGFFPEWANCHSVQMHGETCQLTDMIALALRLSEAGAGDYWDDADRWIRNHLAEAQLLNTDWIYRIQGGNRSHLEAYGSAEKAPERNLGAFAGSPNPNDWYSGTHHHGIGHCCTANGAKVLFWAWERVLRFESGRLRINLLLNRASPWADVDSYIPYVGRADVRIKQSLELSVRIPEWVSPPDVRGEVNGQSRPLTFDGRYAFLGAVKPGDVATVCFPISERTNHVHIEKHPYTLVRKGNEVVSIDPPGRYCPLYQRQHYREGVPRWRQVTRFVPQVKR